MRKDRDAIGRRPAGGVIMFSRVTILGTLVALAGCASAPRPAPAPTFYVMRHLHTPAGVRDPDLTATGQAAAQALSIMLDKDRPRAIYVSNTRRAQQTAAPLAARSNIIPKIYDPADTAGLITTVTSETGIVLIVGHSNTVPDIVERLGGERPAALVHEDFGDLWRIAGSPRVTTRLRIQR
jgi:phosphohistidine phosphatase SixA